MEELARTTHVICCAGCRRVGLRRADIMACPRDAVEHLAKVACDADAILISLARQSPR